MNEINLTPPKPPFKIGTGNALLAGVIYFAAYTALIAWIAMLVVGAVYHAEDWSTPWGFLPIWGCTAGALFVLNLIGAI